LPRLAESGEGTFNFREEVDEEVDAAVLFSFRVEELDEKVDAAVFFSFKVEELDLEVDAAVLFSFEVEELDEELDAAAKDDIEELCAAVDGSNEPPVDFWRLVCEVGCVVARLRSFRRPICIAVR
jgi:hypothetical protein